MHGDEDQGKTSESQTDDAKFFDGFLILDRNTVT